MGFGEQTEDRDLPDYIVVGTEHPDGGTGYYAAARAGLTRVSRIFREQRDAILAIQKLSRFQGRWLRDRARVMEDLMYNDPVLNKAEEPEEPAYRRVKTPTEDVDYFTGDRVVTDDGIRPAKASDYFTGAYGNVALGMEAPYPLNLSEEQTEKVASALLTFNLLGFRVRLERIHG